MASHFGDEQFSEEPERVRPSMSKAKMEICTRKNLRTCLFDMLFHSSDLEFCFFEGFPNAIFWIF